MNRDTIHFNADASNTELLFRTTHSANQFSIYGASRAGVKSSVEDQMRKNGVQTSLHQKINEEILKSVNPQEVNSLVRTPRNGAPVSRKRIARMSSEL